MYNLEELSEGFTKEDLLLTKAELEINLPANIRGLEVAIKSGDNLRLLNAAMAVTACWKKVIREGVFKEENLI